LFYISSKFAILFTTKLRQLKAHLLVERTTIFLLVVTLSGMIVSRWMQISGLASLLLCVLSFSILLRKRTSWTSEHGKVLCYVAFSDILTSLGMSLGYVQEGSALCWMQTLLTNICPLWSILWTACIAYIVMKLVTEEGSESKAALLPSTASWLCWGIPIVVTLLILTTNSYGCASFESDRCWCWIGLREESPSWSAEFWTYASFYFWVFLSLTSFVICFTYAWVHTEGSKRGNNVRMMMAKRLLAYPIIIFVCWFVSAICDSGGSLLRSTDLVVEVLAVFMPGLQGSLTAIVLMYCNLQDLLPKKKITRVSIEIPVNPIPPQHPLAREHSRVELNSNLDSSLTSHPPNGPLSFYLIESQQLDNPSII
jgi:hypothetical protein